MSRAACCALLLASCIGLAAAAAWQPKPGAKSFKLADVCPGNLVVNGDFERPDPTKLKSQVKGHGDNKGSRWGWYNKETVPGWYPGCVRADWETKTSLTFMEIHHRSVADPPEGNQYMELLPNGTGVSCQDIQLDKGGKYKLSFMYGRLMTYAWRPPNIGSFQSFESKAAVGIRDATKKYPRSGVFARNGNIIDPQGVQVLVQMDTTKQASQWQKYETTFTAPSKRVSLVFTTTKRPGNCGTCGSMIDAVCLQKV